MTMIGKSLAAALVAAGALTFAPAARAGDTLRLGGTTAPTLTLGHGSNDAIVVDVGHRYYRGHVRYGYYPRVYFSPRFYYYPRVYYRPYVYAYPRPVVYAAPYVCPIGGTFRLVTPVVSLSVNPAARPVVDLSINPVPLPPAGPVETAPAPRAVPGGDPTFPYDGGPANPVPLPRTEAGPTAAPPPTIPLEGRPVSLTTKPAKLTYPAYGERR
jgi:hypothetical protein